MKVRRLAFRALGPYPGEHVIDFDRLSVSGLFLLCGPTGSGKSAIIDAITFALYGSIEGAKERLHSDHAANAVEPYAELVFETSSGLYRVWRSPEYDRPKLRGEGTTRQNSRARLFRLTSEDQIGIADAGEAMSAHVQDVGSEIGGLVGLTVGQFLQTIVLPQGEFARFLTTKPDQRQELLQTIFNTAIYQKTEKHLREQSVAAGRSVESARTQVGAALQTLWGGRDGIPEITELTWRDTSPLCDAGRVLVEGVRAVAEQSGAAAEAARVRSDEAQAALRQSERVQELLGRRAAARAVLAAQEEQAEQIIAERERARQASAASGLRSTFQRADEVRVAAEAAASAVVEVRALAGAAVGALDGAGLEQHRDESQARVSALEEARGTEERLGNLEREFTLVSERIASETNALEENQRQRDSLPVERDTLQEELTAAAAARARLEGHAREVTRLEELERTALRFGTLEKELTRAVTAEDKAGREADAARRRESEVRASWLGGIAGDLAAELTDGVPCAVCGSTEHPSPARRADGSANKAAAEAAREASARKDKELASLRRAADQLAAQHEEVAGRLGDESAEGISEKLEAARNLLAADQRAAEKVETITMRISGIAEQERSLSSAIEAARRRIEEVRAAAARISGEAGVARAVVGKARGEYPSVAAALEAARGALGLVEAVRAAITEASEASRTQATVVSGLKAASRDAGFASVEEARAALLPEEELNGLRRRLDVVDSERAAANSTLAEPEIVGLTGREEPEVEARRAESQKRWSELEEANDRRGAARRDLEEAERCFRELETALEKETATAAGVRSLVRMSEVVNGKNGRSMRLTTYVLLRRFEDVVRAANLRLATMSDGRYELRRADEEGGQRARGQGLGLEVMDYTTGRVRSPHTLSGGETFYTSLALALGLADVVTDESGGIQLGTLFVDEGFGTLDSDTLDNVMDVLQSLSSGGRAVGIVSHVTELRNQIHEQIQVCHAAGGRGSILTVVA